MAGKNAPGTRPPGQLNEQEIASAIGTLTPISKKLSVTMDVDSKVEDATARDVRQVLVDLLLISAKYNDIAKATGKDARDSVDKAELERDSATLSNLLAQEYNLVDPYGNIHSRDATGNAVLAGAVQWDKIGKGGFETLDDTIKVYSDTAVWVGTINMKGSMKTKTSAGATRKKDISGLYRQTHTFAKREGRWVLTSTHMTQVPKGRKDRVAFK